MSIHPELLTVLLDLDLRQFPNTNAPEATLKQRAADSLRSSFLKKLVPNGNTSVQDARSLKLFAEMNEHCRTFEFTADQHDDATFMALTYARDFISNLMTSELDYPLNIVWRGRFGPGASVACKEDDFVTKSSNSPLSCTDPLLYDFYIAGLTRSRTDLEVEKLRRSRYGRCKVVPGSHTSCVPKNAKISRTICTEPLLNMFLQQGIGSYISDRLRTVGIDIRQQQFVNRALARQGSEDGSLATIDLTSASDTISVSLCDWLLPGVLNAWLHCARSPATRVNGEWLDLYMISSMGNAFTFPLQTMIFSALVYGAYKVQSLPFVSTNGKRTWSVFGDDIIVDSRANSFVLHLLRTCGFFPNVDKSFSEGPFRESCGADYFNGANVRGVYITSLSGQHDLYSAINRLTIWSATWDIPLYRTISYLLARVKYRPVPTYEDPSCGVYVPRSFVSSDRYVALEVAPRRYRLRCDNPFVTLQAALQGALRGGYIGLRLRNHKPRYRKKTSVGWDCFLRGSVPALGTEGVVRWKHLMSVLLWENWQQHPASE